MSTTHTFRTDIAKMYGIEEAIILNNIYFWVSKNIANRKNFHDGNCWTYNSIKAFSILFDYMSEKSIRNTLKKLIDEGLIVTGNYNKLPYDRTLWYALTEKGMNLFGESLSQFKELHLPKRENGFSEKGEPIPDINTDDKPESILYTSPAAKCLFDDTSGIERSLDEIKDFYEITKDRITKANKETIEKFIDSFNSISHINNFYKSIEDNCYTTPEEASRWLGAYIRQEISEVLDRNKKKFFPNSLSYFLNFGADGLVEFVTGVPPEGCHEEHQ